MSCYVQVPPTILDPLPQQRGLSPSGKAHRKGTAQRGSSRSEQPSPSRQVISITYTQPSDVAKDALIALVSQPEADPRHKNDAGRFFIEVRKTSGNIE